MPLISVALENVRYRNEFQSNGAATSKSFVAQATNAGRIIE